MVSESSPDWLPEGWIMQQKLRFKRPVTHFSNVETGQTFYSKEEVLRYVTMANAYGVASQPAEVGHASYEPPQPIQMDIGNPTTPQADSNKTGSRKKTVANKTGSRKKAGINKTRKKNSSPTPVKSKEPSEGLPEGWITELKLRKNGIEQKCYVDPATGRTFYAKPQVFRYLATLNNAAADQDQIGASSDINPVTEHSNGGSPKQDVSQKLELFRSESGRFRKKKEVGPQDASQNREIVISGIRKGWQRKDGVGKKFNEVLERGPAAGLPPGWIKELRVRNKKTNFVNKVDPYFIDSTSGYIFRSLLDALRFVETGDIYKCAIKPRKGEPHELEFLDDSTFSPSVVEKKGSTDNTTERELFEDENPKAGIENSAEAPEAENPEENILLDNKSEGKEVSEPKTAPETENPEEKLDDKFEAKIISEPKTAPQVPETENPEEKLDNKSEAKTISEPKPAPEAENPVENHPIDNESEAKKISEPKSKVSKRKRATKVLVENITLEEEKSPKKTKKENITVTSPGRSSKRLTGVKPEMIINLGLNERALRAAAKSGGKTDTDVHEEKPMNESSPISNDFVDYFARSEEGNAGLMSCTNTVPQQSGLDNKVN